MDDEQFFDKMDGVLETFDYLERRKDASINKMFSTLEGRVPFIETLRSYSRSDLEDIRKLLNLHGLSNLNKQLLSLTMEQKIREMLPDIISRLTEREFKIIKRLIKNNGSIPYSPELRDDLLYLRRLGFIGCLTESSNHRFIYLPEDIFDIVKDTCSNLEVVSSIRLNEKVNKLLRGLLYHYGVIDYMKIHNYIDKYFKEPANELQILRFIVENSRKEYGIEFDGTYLYHQEVFDPAEVEKEQNMRPNLEFLDLSEAQVLSASENHNSWSLFDRKLSNFLTNNFDIQRIDAEEYISELKMDFRSGVNFNEAVTDLCENFDLADINMLHNIIGQVKDVYNNTGQWVLKGHTPLEVRALNLADQAISQVEDDDSPSFKAGRNDPCPCGSGKKYKHCCLKRHL